MVDKNNSSVDTDAVESIFNHEQICKIVELLVSHTDNFKDRQAAGKIYRRRIMQLVFLLKNCAIDKKLEYYGMDRSPDSWHCWFLLSLILAHGFNKASRSVGRPQTFDYARLLKLVREIQLKNKCTIRDAIKQIRLKHHKQYSKYPARALETRFYEAQRYLR